MSHTTYAALRPESGSADFTAADFTGSLGTSTTTEKITISDFSGNHYIAFAVPETAADLTVWQADGDPFNYVGTLYKVLDGGGDPATISLGGEDHVVYRYGSDASTPVALYDTDSGQTYTLR